MLFLIIKDRGYEKLILLETLALLVLGFLFVLIANIYTLDKFLGFQSCSLPHTFTNFLNFTGSVGSLVF